jgi:thiamine kinase-like enzyme
MCSVQNANLSSATMKSAIARLLGQRIRSLERIGGGRNSQVYQLTCENADVYVAKFYYRHSQDDRDRLEAEFSGLQFLWENGTRSIPRPIADDRASGCAIYEYINGLRISSEEITGAEIDSAVDFLEGLRKLVSKEGSRSLPTAAEACFSIKAIISNIRLRLDRLTALPSDKATYLPLHQFLKEHLTPSFHEVIKWSDSQLYKLGKAGDTELPYIEKTLSPSDFGFHNALRCPGNRIIFLDFEYFGWDDPAKMIADFLLHPGMEMREALKQRFFTGMMARFRESRFLDNRVRIVYPLFGIKWCVILLNEFVPELLARRGFAVKKDINKVELQTAQLAKARAMLSRVMSEYEHFPYHS